MAVDFSWLHLASLPLKSATQYGVNGWLIHASCVEGDTNSDSNAGNATGNRGGNTGGNTGGNGSSNDTTASNGANDGASASASDGTSASPKGGHTSCGVSSFLVLTQVS